MRIKFRLAALVLTLAAVGCARKVSLPNFSSNTTPEIKFTKFTIEDGLFTTCDKKDAEQPTPSPEAQTLNVQDQIDTKVIQMVNCDKKVILSTRGPIRNLDQFVAIQAPSGLRGPVNYVLVKNFRTCASDSFRAEEPPMNPPEYPPLLSNASLNGATNLRISNSTLIGMPFMSVREGRNVLQLHYLGKCLKYKENVDPKMGDAFNCAEAEELGNKMVVLQVKIEHVEQPGIETETRCNKKK